MYESLSLATPFWVNLSFLLPLGFFLFWRKHPLRLSKSQVLFTALFGTAFGFIECAVVIYLRAVAGSLPGFHGTLQNVQKLAIHNENASAALVQLPQSLLTIEIIREIFTLVMLATLACAVVVTARERLAIFLWAGTFWDFFYYVFLYATIRWPGKLTTVDVLFLVPHPWIGQVWIPMLIDILIWITLLMNRISPKNQK